jgi:hypothetical protein
MLYENVGVRAIFLKAERQLRKNIERYRKVMIALPSAGQ